MIVVVNKFFLAKGFKGVSLWPFVVIRDKGMIKDTVFLNHERIHLKQQQEMLVIPFYLWYTGEFLIRYLLYRNAYKAYYNISFEREAYRNEFNMDYCSQRKFWSFTKYLFGTT